MQQLLLIVRTYILGNRHEFKRRQKSIVVPTNIQDAVQDLIEYKLTKLYIHKENLTATK